MSRRKTPRVVVLGGINTDYVVRSKALPEPGQTVQGSDLFVGPGGKGANQAVVATRLGAEVFLIGQVGRDERGKLLVKALTDEGVNTRFITFDSKRATGAAIIAVDNDGEKQISAALGANMTLRPAQVRKAEKVIREADVLLMQFETAMDCVLAAARVASKRGIKIVLDPAPPTKFPAELFKLVYAIRPNSDEAEQLTGVKVKDRASARRAARALIKKGVQIAAVQAGDAGDLIVSNDEEVFVPRMKVKSIDATGAGDAFAAGLAVGIAEGLPLVEAARLANATAALSTTKFGAQAGMPTRAAVERFLKKTNS